MIDMMITYHLTTMAYQCIPKNQFVQGNQLVYIHHHPPNDDVFFEALEVLKGWVLRE